MTLVWLFPGQSSRYPAMLHKLSGLSAELPILLEEACDLLGRDLMALDRSDAPYERNRDIQVAVFLANLMCERALAEQGLEAPFSAGLSLGQYNHLVHIDALSWQEALRLVNARGEAYDQGPSGAMASIQPVSLSALQEMLGERCGTPGRDGHLEIVNRNSPRQQVIAGEQGAIERACTYLEEEHYLAPMIIERKIPMHAGYFAPVAQALQPALEAAKFRPPKRPYLCNRVARFASEPTAAQLRESLAAHVHSPVLWQASIEALAEVLSSPVFVEVGPMGILSALLDRRWMSYPKFKCDRKEGLAEHFQETCAALKALSVSDAAVHSPYYRRSGDSPRV